MEIARIKLCKFDQLVPILYHELPVAKVHISRGAQPLERAVDCGDCHAERIFKNRLLTVKWQLSSWSQSVLGSSPVSASLNNLPEFEAPPLHEVVMGIQFQPVARYQQIRSFEVWRLFSDHFPVVQEHPRLGAQFETFGLPSPPSIPFNLVTGAEHDRFWFMSEQGHDLIQFQPDRLLHNWRKMDIERAEYPRFENIIKQFREEITKLQDYFAGLGNPRLVVTQCELSYLNRVELDESRTFNPQDWFEFVASNEPPVDEFMCVVKRILYDAEGKPYGRLYRESATGVDRKGRRLLSLNLTARGRPAADTIDEALVFLENTRRMIADEFLRSTTPQAHKLWKRVR